MQPEFLAATTRAHPDFQGAITRAKAKPETNPVKRFYKNGKKGWRAAINAMCAHCMGCSTHLQGPGFVDHIEPGFRVQIRDCSSPGCPLHHLRPYQDKDTGVFGCHHAGEKHPEFSATVTRARKAGNPNLTDPAAVPVVMLGDMGLNRGQN